MYKINKVIITGLLLILSVSSQAKQPIDPHEKIVRQEINAFMQKNAIPGVAVEMYINGEPHSYYFGYAKPTKKVPITKNTIFELGSISKIMTSLLLAQEIDAAKMQLDDSVTKFLPTLPKKFAEITLQDLATHTAGLPVNPPAFVATQASLQKYLQTLNPTLIEDKWIYSNIGMGLLGEALVNATHKNANQLYRQKILAQLKMQPIAFEVPSKLKRYYAQGYDKTGQAASPVHLTALASAFGIKASAEDMQHFLRAAIGLPGTPDRIFYPMRMTQSAYVVLPNQMQGLGWLIHPINSDEKIDALLDEPAMNFKPVSIASIYDKPIFHGDVLIDKTGATDGFRSYIALIPNKKSGIVILANKQMDGNAIANTGREILFKLTNLVDEDDGLDKV